MKIYICCMTKKEKIELLKSIDRKADYEINVDGKKKIMNGKRLIAFIISQLKVLIKKLEDKSKQPSEILSQKKEEENGLL